MAMSISAKLMEEKLKIGWTTSEFARHFGMTEKEFLESISKIFSSKAVKGMRSRLQQNDKRFQRQVNNIQKRKKVHNEKGTVGLENLEIEEEKIMDEQLEEDPGVCEEDKEMAMEEILKQLEDEEVKIRKQLYQREISKEKLRKQRKELYQKLENEREAIVTLKEKIVQHREQTSKIISEINDVSTQMSDLRHTILEDKERLESIYQEMKALKKVNIYVYDNEEIEADNFKIDIGEEWEQKFLQIMKEEAVEELAVKQTKQLAKLLILVEMLKQQDIESEISFESEIMQQAFKQLM